MTPLFFHPRAQARQARKAAPSTLLVGAPPEKIPGQLTAALGVMKDGAFWEVASATIQRPSGAGEFEVAFPEIGGYVTATHVAALGKLFPIDPKVALWPGDAVRVKINLNDEEFVELRRMWAIEDQRDALLEVLKYLDKAFRQHGRQHWPEAVRVAAAIKAVEGKT